MALIDIFRADSDDNVAVGFSREVDEATHVQNPLLKRETGGVEGLGQGGGLVGGQGS